MPAVTERGPRKVVRKPKSTAPPLSPDQADRTRAAHKPTPKRTPPPISPDVRDRNTRPATPPPPVKERIYAHPQRKEPQKVIQAEVDRLERERQLARVRRENRANLKRTVSKLHVTPVQSPDARDSSRSPAQLERDAAAVAKSVRESREKYLRRTGRGGGVRAVKRLAKGVPGAAGRAYGSTDFATIATPLGAATTLNAAVGGPGSTTTPKVAPAAKVFEQLARTGHGVAGGAIVNVRHIKKHGLKLRPFYAQASPLESSKGVLRGIRNKDKYTFSDVLGEAGWKPKGAAGKVAKFAAGTTLDIGTDPLLLVGGGTGTVAGRVGEKLAVKATRASGTVRAEAKEAARIEKALAPKSARRQQAREDRPAGEIVEPPLTLAQRAAARAEEGKPLKHGGKPADQTTGLRVTYGGAEIPGVRVATAVASKPVRAVARKVVPARVRRAVRAGASDVNPNAVPPGTTRKVSEEATAATRTSRSSIARGTAEAEMTEDAIKRRIGEANYLRVVDAIEHGTVHELPASLKGTPGHPGPAVMVQALLKESRRLERRGGIPVGEIKARPQVMVPEVTADVKASRKAVAAARREEAAAERAHAAATARHNVYQGRAEVLSRNVSGATAEKTAERGRNVPKAQKVTAAVERVRRRALAKGLTPAQADSEANKVAAALHAPKYAGGGTGVRDTAAEIRDAETRLRNATKARETAEAAHGDTVVEAAAQRAARTKAEATNVARAEAPKGYVPHQLTTEYAELTGKTPKGVGRETINPPAARKREHNVPLSVIREEEPGKFEKDLSKIIRVRRTQGVTASARAELNRRIGNLGRTISRGKSFPIDREHEGVYHLYGPNLSKEPLTDKEVEKVLATGSHDAKPIRGRYVVLNKRIADRVNYGADLKTPLVNVYDTATGGFKTVALATPGYHTRNIVGDTWNAYLGQPGYHIPENMRDAFGVLVAESIRSRAIRSLDVPPSGTLYFDTPKYGKVTFAQAARELGKVGAMRSGFTSRELRELNPRMGEWIPGVKAAKKSGFGRALGQTLLNREDLPRLTSAIETLKNGGTWEQAASHVAGQHFDYGHLTPFERTWMRRAMPFYTFTARNIPLQARSLLTKPGKYANFEHVRENAVQGSGVDEEYRKARAMTQLLRDAGVRLPDGWESMMSEYEQRNLGIPVRWKGKVFTVSAGLPLQDINEFPGAALGNQLTEYAEKGMSMANPIFKDAVEMLANHNFFFRDPIERAKGDLVPAPKWVRLLPPDTQKMLGVTENYFDKRTGKTYLAYRAKADYVVNTIPGTPQYINKLLKDAPDRLGKGRAAKALQYAGLKLALYDPVNEAVALAGQREQDILDRQTVLRKQVNPANRIPISAKNPTPEYTKLGEQLRIVNRIQFEGKRLAGWKTLPAQGGPRRGRSSGGIRLGTGVGPKIRLGTSSGPRIRLGGG